MVELFLAAALLPAAPPEISGPPDLGNIESISIVEGKCEGLVIAGRDRSPECRTALAVLAYRDGRMSFAFTGEGIMVSFTGTTNGSSDGGAERILDAITIATGGEDGAVATDALRATGFCHFSKSGSGPASVRCSASTASGEFRGEFATNGKPPVTQRF